MTRRTDIAVVGMACRYPDADSPRALWETVLARRRAFRRIPRERLDLADYRSEDRAVPDTTYLEHAAVLEGWSFDRVAHRVSGSQYRSADLAHWLALDVAAEALSDAGFPAGDGLDRRSTGVVLGNTLTGEFSRANVMRLRWPYVRRVVEASLVDAGWDEPARREFLAAMEPSYKHPFPEVTEETLAGGLANTIAGRICNVFDFGGGGYIVDGACAASLLAVTQAASQLVDGDLDVAVTGGVDLSLDPFELVGFAAVGALAPETMRVYDARSAGFWPGEGCGMLVLMRAEDALAQGRRVYAVLKGWGVSSDGSGGITRPEVEGQLLALDRAYRRAGYGAETVQYFEGHGTGTEVGDATELQVLARAHGSSDHPAAVGSVKANIGHTKAAAGAAGLIKAVQALHHRTLPPMTGCDTPHALLQDPASPLRVLAHPEAWNVPAPRAGVSAMGFGGINTHVTLEAAPTGSDAGAMDPRFLVATPDAELLVLSDDTHTALAQRARDLARFTHTLSFAELGDLAAHLASTRGAGAVRGAVVGNTPGKLADALENLAEVAQEGGTSHVDPDAGVFLAKAGTAPRIGFLFTGQGSPAHLGGGLWRRRFPVLNALYARAGLPADGDGVATDVAQPAICTASLAGLLVLDRLGIEAEAGVGHSLGELTALAWAGAYAPDALIDLARARGRAMAELGDATGAMAGLGTDRAGALALIEGTGVVVAGLNGRLRTVVSGTEGEIDLVLRRAQGMGVRGGRLPVSHAFHSPLVAACVPSLRAHLETLDPDSLQRTVISTVTGCALTSTTDLASLLCEQVISPVRFEEALSALAGESDLLIEVGPGETLTRLAEEAVAIPVLALDAGSGSLRGLLHVAGAAYVLGAPVAIEALTEDRFVRPMDPQRPRVFLANPCESAPSSGAGAVATRAVARPEETSSPALTAASPLELVRELVARKAELPVASIEDGHRLLGDLNLNSIVVGQLVADAMKALGLPSPAAPTEFSGATVAELGEALAHLAETADGQARPDPGLAPGVSSWVRCFQVTQVPVPRGPVTAEPSGTWQVLGPGDHPWVRALADAALPGNGVLVVLGATRSMESVDHLLAAARSMREHPDGTLTLIQERELGGGFVRSLHLETGCRTRILTVDPGIADLELQVAGEIAAGDAFVASCLAADGTRTEPAIRVVPEEVPGTPPSPLTDQDVLLVTGGGKGIAAECALALARETGCALLLLGRSDPDDDSELAANLERLRTRSVRFDYRVADVTRAEEVRQAIAAATPVLGPVSALLHGAGVNRPRLVADLSREDVAEALAPKVDGLKHLLDAVDPRRLRLLVALGSVIARSGLAGEAHYGLANEWLVDAVARFRERYPDCRAQVVEYSVWSGAGMGERLGRMEALARMGITAIPIETGVSRLLALMAQPRPAASVVVAGRLGSASTLDFAGDPLPVHRFLERPRVHIPGVELVADADLSVDADPYLDDHRFRGERVFPAVMGLEAMAQATRALTGRTPSGFSGVRFRRPIVVGEEPTPVRVAVLWDQPDRVRAVLRAGTTGFGVDHFEAVCHLEPASVPSLSAPAARDEDVELDPQRDLYGALLFHQGRFRRVAGYRHLEAASCVARLEPPGESPWFGPYLPGDLLLADPGARDALLHAIQACIPHASVLPSAVERVTRGPGADGVRVVAHERVRETDRFVYDATLFDDEDRVVEHWEGLELRVLEPVTPSSTWPASLWGPYLERRVSALLESRVLRLTVASGGEPRERGAHALERIGAPRVSRRPDGKPEPAEGSVSVSHANGFTLAVTAPGAIGCDVELVPPRPDALRAALGQDRWSLVETLTRESGEPMASTAARIWSVMECLKKSGASPAAPILFLDRAEDGWMTFRAGDRRLATYVTPGPGHPMSVSVCLPEAGVGGSGAS